MAFINKTDILTNNVIEADHITRIIDVLSGASALQVSFTGAVTASNLRATGSLSGNASSATSASIASLAVTASFSVSSSLAALATSASFSTTSSYSSRSITASYSSTSSYTESSISASYSATASYTETVVTASYSLSTQYEKANNGVVFDNGGALSAYATPLVHDAADTLTGTAAGTINLSSLGSTSGNGFVIPTTAPNNPVNGSIYLDVAGQALKIYLNSIWKTINL